VGKTREFERRGWGLRGTWRERRERKRKVEKGKAGRRRRRFVIGERERKIHRERRSGVPQFHFYTPHKRARLVPPIPAPGVQKPFSPQLWAIQVSKSLKYSPPSSSCACSGPPEPERGAKTPLPHPPSSRSPSTPLPRPLTRGAGSARGHLALPSEREGRGRSLPR
jgi:hypothetical protein